MAIGSIRKRKWTAPDGTEKSAYQITYKDQAGRIRTETKSLKKQAEQRLQEITAELHAGTHVGRRDTVTVAALCDEWLQHCEDRVKDGRITKSTWVSFEIMCRTCLVPCMGGMLVKDVEERHIEDLFQWILKNRKMAPSTAKKRLKLVGSMWHFARKRKYTSGVPVADALLELRSIVPEPIETFDVDQIVALIIAAETRDRTISRKGHALKGLFLHIALFCGLRVGEICALKISNVDIQNRVLHVKHNLSTINGLKGTKTKSGLRAQPMPKHVADMLAAYIDNFYDPNDRDLIFTTMRLGPIFPSNVWQDLWQPLLRKAGIPKGYHFHALRHFYNSWLMDNGVAVANLVKLMGHKSFDTTLRVYSHTVRGDAARMEEVDRATALLLSHADFQRLPTTPEAAT